MPRTKKLPKLTSMQLYWLRVARTHGYEKGFAHKPIPSLRVLETAGLVESNPSTSGEHTHWRVTQAGLDVPKGMLWPQ